MFLGKEHWIGLDNIYKLTNRKNVKTELRIDLELFSGKKTSVTYDDFYLKAQVVFTFTYYLYDDECHIFDPNLTYAIYLISAYL